MEWKDSNEYGLCLMASINNLALDSNYAINIHLKGSQLKPSFNSCKQVAADI